MTDESKREHERAILLSQYQQANEDLRQIDRFMWQIPSLLVVIVGALVVVVFTFMLQASAPLWVREGVLGIALVLTVVMMFVQRRHRHFGSLMTGALSSIEYRLGVKHIQRTAIPDKSDPNMPKGVLYPKGLRYRRPLGKIGDGIPGPDALFLAMVFMSLIIVLLMCFIVINPDTQVPPSSDEKCLSWIVVGLSIFVAMAIVAGTRRREYCKEKERKK